MQEAPRADNSEVLTLGCGHRGGHCKTLKMAMVGGSGYVSDKVKVLVAQSCLILCDPTDCSPPGSSIHGDSPGKNTGVGSLSLLQGNFPTQELNWNFLHCRRILLGSEPPQKPLSHVNRPDFLCVRIY